MNITNDQIKGYLQNRIKQSIINDVGTAINCYSQYFTAESGAFGFFAIPRMLFPEIDGLGSYMTGKPDDTTNNISTFINEIMSRVDEKYRGNGGFIAKVYRHGLLHQHEPKRADFNGVELGWGFSLENANNPVDIRRKYNLMWQGQHLNLSVRQFYEDTLEAIDIFIPLVLGEYRSTFIKSYIAQNKPKKITISDCTYDESLLEKDWRNESDDKAT